MTEFERMVQTMTDPMADLMTEWTMAVPMVDPMEMVDPMVDLSDLVDPMVDPIEMTDEMTVDPMVEFSTYLGRGTHSEKLIY